MQRVEAVEATRAVSYQKYQSHRVVPNRGCKTAQSWVTRETLKKMLKELEIGQSKFGATLQKWKQTQITGANLSTKHTQVRSE